MRCHEAARTGDPHMATATETTTRNGVQTAEETARNAQRAYDALTEYYLTAFDAGLKFQARWIETAKLLLDESAAFQRSSRKLSEELLHSSRRTQQDVQSAWETNLKTIQSA